MSARTAVRGGFTLVEVVVVLLIIGIAAGAAVPALRAPRRDAGLDSAARTLDTLLRIARDSAVRGGAAVTLTVDSATGAVWLVTAGGVAADAAAPAPPAPGRSGRAALPAVPAGGPALELPPGVRLELSQARARFTFRPGGSAFGDSLLIRAGALTRLVRVDPWSGDAIIE